MNSKNQHRLLFVLTGVLALLMVGCGGLDVDADVKPLVEKIFKDNDLSVTCTEIEKIRDLGGDCYAAKASIKAADGEQGVVDIKWEVVGEKVLVTVDFSTVVTMQ